MQNKFCLKKCYNVVTGKEPCVIHCPGSFNHFYWSFFENRIYEEFQTEKDITIVTWNTGSNHRNLGLLEKSLKNYPVLNCAEKYNGKWANNKKMLLLANEINNIKTPYIIGSDSADVIFIKSPIEVLQRFKKLNVKMVFNCEKYFYPDIEETQEYKCFQDKIGYNNPYKYLNAGLWIAETNYIKNIIPKYIFNIQKFSKSQYRESEQIVWHSIFEDIHVSLDYKCELFQNIAKLSPGELSFNPIID